MGLFPQKKGLNRIWTSDFRSNISSHVEIFVPFKTRKSFLMMLVYVYKLGVKMRNLKVDFKTGGRLASGRAMNTDNEYL